MMTELEDKFWDAAITEAATKRRPPDQADRILQRLQEPKANVQEMNAGAALPAPKGRVFQLRRVLEISAAAAALIAIGILTGLIPIGGDTPGSGTEPDPEPRMIAAAPGADYETRDNHVELKDGWLLVTTGAQDVHCEGSTLSGVDGRVLVHAGSMPTGAQAESVADWLNANGLEQAMIMEAKRWVQGVGLAALVLSGSAMLDGSRIEAQEVKPVVAEWQVVRTVMDIDKLPEGAKRVRGLEVSGAHLEFIADRTGIEAVEFIGCEELRASHIRSLRQLKTLKHLDLRGAEWDEEPDYSVLRELGQLEWLGIDYRPVKGQTDGPWPPDDWQERYKIADALTDLAGRGTRISLGNLDDIEGRHLQRIAGGISTLADLDLENNWNVTDADMKYLAEHEKLRKLNIAYCSQITELGLAYLARKNQLESLTVTPEIGPASMYQLSLMTNLQSLLVPSFDVPRPADKESLSALERDALASLVTLKNLRRLGWPENRDSNFEGLKALASLPELKTIAVFADMWNSKSAEWRAFKVAESLPVTRVEILAYDSLTMQPPTSETLAMLKGSEHLREISFQGDYIWFGEESEAGAYKPVLAKFKNLKRIEIAVLGDSEDGSYTAFAKKHLAEYEVSITYGK